MTVAPQPCQLVVFHLDEQRYALHLAAVERIVAVPEVTPLPHAPEIVLGVVNVGGRVAPVVDIRRRFKLPMREVHLSDHLIIASTARRMVAMIVDGATGVIEHREITAAGGIVQGLEYVEGVAKLEDGLILIHNLETFLSLDEEKALDHATESIGNNAVTA